MNTHSGRQEVYIAPKPSTNHIDAAIALSEMSALNLAAAERAEIGIQTDMRLHAPRLLSPSKRDSVGQKAGLQFLLSILIIESTWKLDQFSLCTAKLDYTYEPIYEF